MVRRALWLRGEGRNHGLHPLDPLSHRLLRLQPEAPPWQRLRLVIEAPQDDSP